MSCISSPRGTGWQLPGDRWGMPGGTRRRAGPARFRTGKIDGRRDTGSVAQKICGNLRRTVEIIRKSYPRGATRMRLGRGGQDGRAATQVRPGLTRLHGREPFARCGAQASPTRARRTASSWTGFQTCSSGRAASQPSTRTISSRTNSSERQAEHRQRAVVVEKPEPRVHEPHQRVRHQGAPAEIERQPRRA